MNSFKSGLSNFGTQGFAKAKANPITTVVIVILVLMFLTISILLIVDIATGKFRRRLPGEKCKKNSNCGCGLKCTNGKCALP